MGVMYGWLVRIKYPSLRDSVRNPGAYFSRKGFYALNVQAITDHKNVFYGRLLLMLAPRMIRIASKAQNYAKNFVN